MDGPLGLPQDKNIISTDGGVDVLWAGGPRLIKQDTTGWRVRLLASSGYGSTAARERVAATLATELLAGRWTRAVLQRTIRRVLGPRLPVSRRRLLISLLGDFTAPYPPPPDQLVRYLLASDYLDIDARRRVVPIRPTDPSLRQPLFAPAPPLSKLPVPRLVTPGDLASWLGISIEQLDWMADSRRQHATTGIPILQH